MQQAVDNLFVAHGPLMSFELALELEWARVLVAALPADQRGEALWDELGDDARSALRASLHRLQAEIEGKRMTLVRGGKPRIGLHGPVASPKVDPRAFARALADRLEHDCPGLHLSFENVQHMRAAMEGAPKSEAGDRALLALIANNPESAPDLWRLVASTMSELGG